MYLSKSIDKYIEEFEKKAKKYDMDYQIGGSASSIKTKEKYEDLVEICLAAKITQDEEDKEKARRMKNAIAFISAYEEKKRYARDEKYTLDELIACLNQLIMTIG